MTFLVVSTAIKLRINVYVCFFAVIQKLDHLIAL